MSNKSIPLCAPHVITVSWKGKCREQNVFDPAAGDGWSIFPKTSPRQNCDHHASGARPPKKDILAVVCLATQHAACNLHPPRRHHTAFLAKHLRRQHIAAATAHPTHPTHKAHYQDMKLNRA
jgi:hypothetical protein